MDSPHPEHIINDEIARLRLENASLKVESKDLKAEILSLHIKDTETASQEIGRAVICLPTEVLVLIFERSIPPPFLLDSGLHAGPNSPWCKTLRHKKAIIAVCWSWYNAGIRFLYEDVCIRRFDQLFVLLRTFKSTPRLDFGSMVQSLDISCFVAQTIAPEFDKCFDATVKYCPRLSSIALNLPFYIPQTLFTTPIITKLKIEMKLEYEAFFDIVYQVRGTLLSLHIGLSSIFNDSQDSNIFSRQIVFPGLEGLMLFVPQTWMLDIIKQNWFMPALRAVTFYYRSGGRGRSSPEEWRNSIRTFLSNHGQNLHSLHILLYPSAHSESTSIEGFQFIMKYCPHLEHLITRSEDFSLAQWEACPMAHPKLKWMDLWMPVRDCDDRVTLIGDYFYQGLSSWRRELPSLQGVRGLSNLPDTLYEWLQRFTPRSDDIFTVNCFQEELEQDSSHVLWIQPEWKWTNVMDDTHSNSSDWDSDDDEITSSEYTHSSLEDVNMSDGSVSQLGESEGDIDESRDAEMDTPELLHCLHEILGENFQDIRLID